MMYAASIQMDMLCDEEGGRGFFFGNPSWAGNDVTQVRMGWLWYMLGGTQKAVGPWCYTTRTSRLFLSEASLYKDAVLISLRAWLAGLSQGLKHPANCEPPLLRRLHNRSTGLDCVIGSTTNPFRNPRSLGHISTPLFLRIP
jgi:hypothetical protein